MNRSLIFVSVVGFALFGCAPPKSGGGTMPGAAAAAQAPPRQAATVKGKVAKKGKKGVTHVVALAKAPKGQRAPKPIRVKVRDDGSYELPVYYGYNWAIAYESNGKKVGTASFKTKDGKRSSSFKLTSNTTIVNNVFDLGVYVEGSGYWFETEHSPWEYYDTDGDGQTDWDDADDDNDGTADLDDADDDGDGLADADDDFDLDNDGELDYFDNDDNDGIADAQDDDDDGDGQDDAHDVDDGDGDDADQDGIADQFDNDDDNDGTPDAQDNDDDNDGVADAQDNDDDNDGVADDQEQGDWVASGHGVGQSDDGQSDDGQSADGQPDDSN